MRNYKAIVPLSNSTVNRENVYQAIPCAMVLKTVMMRQMNRSNFVHRNVVHHSVSGMYPTNLVNLLFCLGVQAFSNWIELDVDMADV